MEKIEELRKKAESLKNEMAKCTEDIAQAEAEAAVLELKRAEAAALAKKVEEERKELMRKQKVHRMHLNVNVKLMQRVFNAISLINDDCKITVGEKLSYIGVDPAHVALLWIDVPKTAFIDYKNKEEHEMGIDVDKILGILKRRKSKKKECRYIVFEQYEEDNAIYVSWMTEFGTFHRKVTAVDTAAIPTSKVPKLKLGAKFEVSTKGVIEFCKEAESISDHISITASPEGVEFYADAKSDSDDDVRYPLLKGKKLKLKQTYKSLFSVDYFYNAIKIMEPFFNILSIEMDTDNPVIIHGKGDVEMWFMLAPRIESEGPKR